MDPALGEYSNVNPKCFALNPSTSITLFQTNIFPLFSGSCRPVLFLVFPHTLYFINYSPNPDLHTLTSRWFLLTNSLLLHKYSFVYFLNQEDGVNLFKALSEPQSDQNSELPSHRSKMILLKK